MLKKLDHWCDINWLIFICATGAVTAFFAAIFWEQMPLGTKAGAFAAVIMSFHVLEEWKFPGGLHCFSAAAGGHLLYPVCCNPYVG